MCCPQTISARRGCCLLYTSFSYVEGEPVLKNLTLSVKPGQKIAIVGATGSGKTTIVNLLMRFYELDSGNITIDGIDGTDIPKETLRHAIAIVLQDTVLFSDTIRSNIKYGRLDASDDDMKRAAATARADTFIERLPEGYDLSLIHIYLSSPRAGTTTETRGAAAQTRGSLFSLCAVPVGVVFYLFVKTFSRFCIKNS